VTFSLVGSVVALILTVMTTVGLAGLLALMAVESFGIPPLPSEVILPFAGFLVATGAFALLPTIVVALAGSLAGAFAAYAVGRWWRPHLLRLRMGPFGVQEHHLERMDAWFRRHGEVTVALSRCVPVVRAYISYPAGTARMAPVRFGLYTLAGSVPYTLALIYAGILLGHRWTEIEGYFFPLDLVVYALIVVGAVYLLALYLRARREALRARTQGPSTPPGRPPRDEPAPPPA
jgi:membrane protein DedA with SNARE-associated domain